MAAAKRRGPYREDFSERLGAIEARRRALGITQTELAMRAGVDRTTLQRALASGRAFRRTLNALTLAVRELEKEGRRKETLFRK